jgi:crotonobetainyl-CoA:carnitine CoA-transferase CaiB-like acyl-CoA transferase
VIDFGQGVAGPGAARLLADHGADVVHIASPHDTSGADRAELVLNQGKTKIVRELAYDADLREVKELIVSADVLVENFQPGTMRRFGLDYQSLQATNPGLVYLSLPGFASTDEQYTAASAYEGVIASAVGQFADMGVNRVLMGIEASYSPLPLGSAYAAAFGALSVALALRARLRTGRGDNIEVPVASCLAEALAYNSMRVADAPERYVSRREREISRRRQAGLPMDLTFNEVQEFMDPFYRSYWCADGRPLYIVALAHRAHPQRVLEILGIYEEAVAQGLPMFDPYLSTDEWPAKADCTLFAHPISEAWSKWLAPRIAQAIAARTSAHWEQAFAKHGVPAIAHRTTAEWMTSGHAVASGLVTEVDYGDNGTARTMGPVSWTEGVHTVVPPRNHLTVDARVDAVSRGWLEDTTVLDLTNVIAGPTIASTLARFGARVIKIDPPTPTFDPWTTILCGIQSNRGKESLLLDLRKKEGTAALGRLIEQADVVTVNATNCQLRSLELSAVDLARKAPHAILCHLDAWSGPEGGPWAQHSGYDDLVQAATGIMARFGGGLSTPEEHAHFGTIDVLAGICGAFATAAALFARDESGRVLVARTSLAAAGQLIQAPFMIDHPDRGPWDEPSGRETRGESPTYRLYQASDGWMFVVIPDDTRLLRLSTKLGAPLAHLGSAELQKTLSDAFSSQPVDHWRHLLAGDGIAIQPLETLIDLREKHTVQDSSPWNSSSFSFTEIDGHPSGRRVTLAAPNAVRPHRSRVVVPGDAPKYGADTDKVLLAAGFTVDEIEELVRVGAASRSWTEVYLPT